MVSSHPSFSSSWKSYISHIFVYKSAFDNYWLNQYKFHINAVQMLIAVTWQWKISDMARLTAPAALTDERVSVRVCVIV